MKRQPAPGSEAIAELELKIAQMCGRGAGKGGIGVTDKVEGDCFWSVLVVLPYMPSCETAGGRDKISAFRAWWWREGESEAR
eukprot:3018353-Rhodomonas_salina.1